MPWRGKDVPAGGIMGIRDGQALTWGALALAAMLAGCGAPSGTGTDTPIDAGADVSRAAPDALAPAPPAHAPTAPDDLPTTMPPDGPVLTPDQAWEKLLALVESLDGEADLNRAHVERVIGLPLAQRPDSRTSQFIAGDTTADWRYIFDLLRYSDDDVRMSFKTYLADMDTTNLVSPTCTYPFRQMHEELVSRGFKSHEMTAALDRAFWWQFSKDGLGIDTHYYFLRPQGPFEVDYEQACLRLVTLSFVIPPEKLRGR